MNNMWYGFLNFFRLRTDTIDQINPMFKQFDQLSDTQGDQRGSVINQFFNQQSNFSAGYSSSSAYVDFVYGAVSTNKTTRLANYRRMAGYTKVGDAIDEICDAAISFNEKQEMILFNLDDKVEGIPRSDIITAWNEYFNLFNFGNNYFEYMRNLCIDGEMAWENIVDREHLELGVIGVNEIRPECFEFAINVQKNEKVGLIIFTNKSDVDLTAQQSSVLQNQPITQQGGIQVQDLSQNNVDALNEGKAMLLPWEQVTYVNTGVYSSDGLVCYPVLERARKAYNQLSLIEDAIIIYRLVRAPERLVFNVDTGTMPRHRAEQEVYKMMKRYQTKKVYNPSSGTISSDYDPMMMIENFWFVKPAGSEGTTVETLATNASLGELDDLKYFVRNLYIALKIPFNRFAEPTVNYERNETISYEEYRFAKFVMRLQSRFANGLLEGFRTHLKLKGLWKQHQLKDDDIKLTFVPPAAFELYEQQKILQLKISNYDAIVAHEEFSRSLAMRKYLGMTDDEVKENYRQLEQDKIQTALIEFKVNNVTSTGKPDLEDFMGAEGGVSMIPGMPPAVPQLPGRVPPALNAAEPPPPPGTEINQEPPMPEMGPGSTPPPSGGEAGTNSVEPPK